MDKNLIGQVVDRAFEKELSKVKKQIDMELYPKALSDDYAYLRVKTAIEINNKALMAAVKHCLAELLSQTEHE